MFWNLAGVDCVSEEVVEKKIVETWVLVKCSFDVAKESDKKFDVKDQISFRNMECTLPAPDDTASSPHESNASIVEVPPELLSGLPEKHEALCVGHDLAGVESLHKNRIP